MKNIRYTCFSRYLAAKKSVDDRALNRHVWESLRQTLDTDREEPLRVLEVGCGIGTMIERVIDWGLLANATYHAIDAEATNIKVLEHRLAKRGMGNVRVSAECCDLFDFLKSAEFESYDLLIAHAFLDLLPLPDALAPLLHLLKPDGLAYLTLNFDGVTHFEPPFNPVFDAQLAARYHANMDNRITNGTPSGDSQTGRHLFTHLQNMGATILAAGSSDWIVHPIQNGYAKDEAYFLHFIIDTIAGALQGELDLTEWHTTRHAQIESADLSYIAHQIDFLCRPAKTQDLNY